MAAVGEAPAEWIGGVGLKAGLRGVWRRRMERLKVGLRVGM